MRNLILSAFPRNMRLPDPFTPNLKVRRRHLAYQWARHKKILAKYDIAFILTSFRFLGRMLARNRYCSKNSGKLRPNNQTQLQEGP